MVSIGVVFWVTAAAALPVVTVMLFVRLDDVLDCLGSVLSRLRPRRPRPDCEPIERLVADLQRIADHYDRVDRSQEMHRAERLRATSIAYDLVLLSACRTLEVEVPDHAPLHAAERLQTEAALAQRGLVW